MYKAFALLLLVIGYWSLVSLSAEAYTFSRDLKLGDSGEDVRALQTSLNANTQTRVAEFGAGSPGAETGFFGEKTLAAVVRYQNLHADTVLRPLGLFEGTGFVGSATRKQLSGATDPEVASKPSVSEAIAAFDAMTSGASGEAVRSPVDDPRIPKTQEELFTAVEDFAGSKATNEEIQDFSRQMVLARYGYPTTLGNASSDEGTPRTQCSDGINNDSGEDTLIDYPNDPDCTNMSDNTERGSGGTTHSGTGGGQDAASGGSGAGCIALLFTFLGL